MTGDSHRHVNRLDGLITVNHVEAHQELVIRVGEVSSIKIHERSTDIRSTSSSVSIELDSRSRIIAVVSDMIFICRMTLDRSNHIARNGMRRSTIISSINVTRNIHNHNTCRHNLQPTVSHIEGNVKVVVGVGELAFVQAHVINTHRSTRSNCIATKDDVCGVIMGVGRIDGITSNGNQVVRKLLDVVITRNQNLNVSLVYSQITIRHIESHICECGVEILELSFCKTHVGGTHRRSRHHGSAIEGEVCRSIRI